MLAKMLTPYNVFRHINAVDFIVPTAAWKLWSFSIHLLTDADPGSAAGSIAIIPHLVIDGQKSISKKVLKG